MFDDLKSNATSFAFILWKKNNQEGLEGENKQGF